MSKIYAKDIDNNVLRRLQLTQVEILDEIARICEDNNLHYYLVGGTLLGAVRHKGFIPWDDDLDIAMPRADYQKFCSLCEKNLKEQYYLHNIDTDNGYWLIFGKVRKSRTIINEESIKDIDVPKGIYVDIFPLDNAPEEKRYIRTKFIKALCWGICNKRGIELKKKLSHRIVEMLLMPFSIFQLTKIQNLLMLANQYKECQYYINYGSNYDTVKQTIPKDKYEPYKLLEFEGKEYRVPNDYDYVLRRIYNNYMELPSEDKRVFRHKPQYIDFGD